MKLQEVVEGCLGPGDGTKLIRRPTFPNDVFLRVSRVPSLRLNLPHSYLPTSNKNYPRVIFEVWKGKDMVYHGWSPSLEDLVADDWSFEESSNG